MAPPARQDVPDRHGPGRIIDDKELKDSLARAKPYREWIGRSGSNSTPFRRLRKDRGCPGDTARSPAGLRLYTQEDIKVIIGLMIQNGEEATGSMGTDSPCRSVEQEQDPV